MSKIIINADDFGYCLERNNGIIESFKNNVISSTTLLVNQEGTLDAIQKLKKNQIPCGIHLNLTEGFPISNPEKILTLLNKNKEFLGKYNFREALKENKIDKKHIEIELEEQIKWFIEHCNQLPTHIDGHNHIHIIPDIANILVLIMKKYNIYKVRIPSECDLAIKYPWLENFQLKFLSIVCKESEFSRIIYYQNNIRSTEYFIGLGLMGKNLTIERLKNIIQIIPTSTTIEYMVHPGYKQLNGGDNFSKSIEREYEMKILNSKEFKKILEDNNIKLISWKDIF